MGTFERSYEVDGERFELYLEGSAGSRRYQLVDEENLPVGGAFSAVPDDALVARVVRADRRAADSAA